MVTKRAVFNLFLLASVLGMLTGTTYMSCQEQAIRRSCREACGTRYLIACHEQDWHTATAFCQDSETGMSVYEVKR